MRCKACNGHVEERELCLQCDHGGYREIYEEMRGELDKHKKVYHAFNMMLLVLGSDGQINAQQSEVEDVYTALWDIDEGQYDSEL